MFIAMEISSRVAWMPFPFTQFVATLRGILSPNSSCPRLGWLGEKVEEQLSRIGDKLMEQFNEVSRIREKLMEQFNEDPPISGPEQEAPLVHAPRHDAESVFWLLWFLLARANPKGEPPVEKDSAQKKAYDSFCSTMLNHTVGAAYETRVPLATSSIEQYRETLHPRFAHLGDMVYYMGRYFLIDPKTWKDYDLDHAYYFMQCLLLQEILRNKERNKEPKILLLDKTRPRPATQPMAPVRSLPVPVESRASHNYSGSLSAVSCSVSSSGSSSLKRKAETDAQGGAPRKRTLASSAVLTELRRSTRLSNQQEHAGLAGGLRTGVQPEMLQTERNPFVPTPDRAESTDDESEGECPDANVEHADYVESQETRQNIEELEKNAVKKWLDSNVSLVQAFDAANAIQMSLLSAEQWFTILTE